MLWGLGVLLEGLPATPEASPHSLGTSTAAVCVTPSLAAGGGSSRDD